MSKTTSATPADTVEKLTYDLSVARAMGENSPINILMANTDLVITYANPSSIRTLKSLQKFLPVRVEDLVGQSIDIFHKNPSFQRNLLSRPQNLPHRAIIEVGDQKLDLLVSATYDPSGAYLGPMVTWEIVTEKLKLQEQGVDAAGKLQGINRCMAVIEFRPDGTILDANDNFCKTLGYRLEEIKGQHHRMFVTEAFANSSAYRDFWTKLNRGEYEMGEFHRVGKGAKEIWINAIYNPIVDANGKVIKVVKFASDITQQVKNRRRDAERSAIIQNAPINIMLANTDGVITYMNPASEKTLKSVERLLPIKVHNVVGSSFDLFHKNPAHQRRLISDPKNLPINTEIQLGDETLSLQVSAIYDDAGTYVGPMICWDVITDRKAAAKREKEQVERDRRQQEELAKKVDEMLVVVNTAASGDLTKDVSFKGEDAMGRLAEGFRKMLADLRQVIGQVVEGAAQFAEGSHVIAESSQSLAQGAQTQSASVEEMSASIEELTRSIESVKDNAGEANRVASDTSRMAEDGGVSVNKSIEAMELIKNSSEQISEIIQVISEIASQTNLLALNAAIEAARAGEHGLGFAVVADEVRKLAERSSEAAKQISKLIKESTQRVADGAKLSEQVGQALKRIISGVSATATKISEIATSTVEQAQNANEVANAIQQISNVTEQSAAASEEMASSSEELGAQASSLRDLVRRFRVD